MDVSLLIILHVVCVLHPGSGKSRGRAILDRGLRFRQENKVRVVSIGKRSGEKPVSAIMAGSIGRLYRLGQSTCISLTTHAISLHRQESTSSVLGDGLLSEKRTSLFSPQSGKKGRHTSSCRTSIRSSVG